MATPTDEQQLRATLRRMGKTRSPDEVARVVLVESVNLIGYETVKGVVRAAWLPDAWSELPPLMGAAEAADVLGMKATNLKRLSPPLPVAAVISGRIPVYRQSDVMEAKARRDARRATA